MNMLANALYANADTFKLLKKYQHWDDLKRTGKSENKTKLIKCLCKFESNLSMMVCVCRGVSGLVYFFILEFFSLTLYHADKTQLLGASCVIASTRFPTQVPLALKEFCFLPSASLSSQRCLIPCWSNSHMQNSSCGVIY